MVLGVVTGQVAGEGRERVGGLGEEAGVDAHPAGAGVDAGRGPRGGRRPLRVRVGIGLHPGLGVHVLSRALPVGVHAARVGAAVGVRVARLLAVVVAAVAVRGLGVDARVVAVVVDVLVLRGGRCALVLRGLLPGVGVAPVVHRLLLSGRLTADPVGAHSRGQVGQPFRVGKAADLGRLLWRDAEEDTAAVGRAVHRTGGVLLAVDSVVLAGVVVVIHVEGDDQAVGGVDGDGVTGVGSDGGLAVALVLARVLQQGSDRAVELVVVEVDHPAGALLVAVAAALSTGASARAGGVHGYAAGMGRRLVTGQPDVEDESHSLGVGIDRLLIHADLGDAGVVGVGVALGRAAVLNK